MNYVHGWLLAHRVNEGVHIYGQEENIDLIIKSIRGPPRNREVKLEIRRIEDIITLYLTPDHGFRNLEDGIEIAITRRYRGKGREVVIIYRIDPTYSIERITY